MYNQMFTVFDWGVATTGITVDMGKTLRAMAIPADAFSVTVQKVDNRQATPLVEEGTRVVTAAYVSDAKGNRVDEGQHIALALACSVFDPFSSPMRYDPDTGFNAWCDCAYTITQQQALGGISGIVTSTLGETYAPQLDVFDMGGRFPYADPVHGNITLPYASYAPAGAYAGCDYPLIVWLHGAGEGGADPSIALAANKACAFADPRMQAYFGTGAYVLVPQCPTVWMDDGTGNPYAPKKKLDSRCLGALMALIEAYVAQNPGIDRDRIYLGGCSNGGYMTVLMALTYPEYFAAAFPVCEAASDDLITDEALLPLKDLPMWFVHAADDTVVPPLATSLATHRRLVLLGADNIHLHYPTHVVDRTGKNLLPDGTLANYPGHFSWIYVYNNDLSTEYNGRTVTLMEWLAAQRRQRRQA